MKRRAALATSLLLTTIAAFAIIGFGRQLGMFGSSGGDDSAPAEVIVPEATPTYVPDPPASSPDPVVIDEYVYQDQYVPVSSGNGSSAASPSATRPTTSSAATAEPTSPPATEAPATPTSPLMVVAPTSPPPPAAPTSPPAPAAPTSPPPPAAPTATLPPPAPAAPPPVSEPEDTAPTVGSGQELEFSGTVTAASSSSATVQTSSGSIVMALDSRTSIHGGALVAGARVTVHAWRTADGTVIATEIEVRDGEGGR